MCDLCKNQANRSYSHSRTPQHRKLLFKKMKEKKIKAIKKYGIFIWKEEPNIKDKIYN